jgi:hypothetical protein
VFEKLKKHPELRQSLGIAVGVFAGLIGYRLVMWAHEWWENLQDHIQRNILLIACAIALLVCLFFAIRWLLRKYGRRRVLVGGPTLLLLIGVALFTAIYQRNKVEAENRIRAEHDRQEYLKMHPGATIAEQMIADGSFPDQPDNASVQYNPITAKFTSNPDTAATATDFVRREREIKNPILDRQIRERQNQPMEIPASSEVQAARAATEQYIEQQLAKQNNCLMANIAAAAQKDKNITAEAKRLGLRSGHGADIVISNMEIVRKITQMPDVFSTKYAHFAPRLTQLLLDSNFNGVGCDDLGKIK